MKPIINMFVGEFKGADFRKKVNGMACRRKENAHYDGNVRLLIHDAIEYYRKLNPDALQTRNGDRVVRPSDETLKALGLPVHEPLPGAAKDEGAVGPAAPVQN